MMQGKPLHKIVEIIVDDQERNLLLSTPLQTQFFEASIKKFALEKELQFLLSLTKYNMYLPKCT